MGDYGGATIAGSPSSVYGRFKSHFSATQPNPDLTVLESIRNVHPDRHVTPIELRAIDLFEFAEAGNATVAFVHDDDSFLSVYQYIPPASRSKGGEGWLGEKITFGRYDYKYGDEQLILYYIEYSTARDDAQMQYILSPKDKVQGTECPTASRLLQAAGKWSSELHERVYVFDSGSWIKSHKLWGEVQSASWDDVIVAPTMKDTLIDDVESLFDSRAVYAEYGVPWKRGIILHGTPGCGKTISIKALMKSLQERNVVSLYVKAFVHSQSIRSIFQKARVMAPCLLIFEDLDSLVTPSVRSYFLNEVDGLENNDGILMVGSTNHLDQLDPGISKRPSRFDRKYHFKLPGETERVLYCNYWRSKLQKNGNIELDEDMCRVVAQLTPGFSFAYMKELFIQALLTIAHGRIGADTEQATEDNHFPVAEQDDSMRDSGSAMERKRIEAPVGVSQRPGAIHAPRSAQAPLPAQVPLPTHATLPTQPTLPTQAYPPTQARSQGIKRAQRSMPEVQIPEHLQQNPMMRVLYRQARSLWSEMDNTSR